MFEYFVSDTYVVILNIDAYAVVFYTQYKHIPVYLVKNMRKIVYTLGLFMTFSILGALLGGEHVNAKSAIPAMNTSAITRSVTTTTTHLAATIYNFTPTRLQIPCGGSDSAGGALFGVFKDVAKGAVGLNDSQGNQITSGSLIGNYVICPQLNAMIDGVQLIIAFIISPILEYQPLLQNGVPRPGLFDAWRVFRDLANVTLIFGFLLVIFSQATSLGLSAYGVRKMLPRIVVAALLINLSYYICAVLVDIFNILGGTLGNTLSTAISSSGATDDTISNIFVGFQGDIAAFVALPLQVMLFIGFLILILFGIVAVGFMLVRQVVITLLIVLSPLALAAWIFPNTSSYFTKWWGNFFKLLAIYPIVSVFQAITIIIIVALASINPGG